MLSVLVLALFDAPVFAYALVLLGWATAGALWFRDDVEGAIARVPDATDPSASESPDRRNASNSREPDWHHWVAGWYWETDDKGVLRAFKPGADATPGLQVDWQALGAFLDEAPAWLSCWADVTPRPDELNRMDYSMGRQIGWADALPLPWPAGLRGLVPGGEGWSCKVRGEPRHDAAGGFLGFHGVLVPVPPAVQAPPPGTAFSQAAIDPAQEAADEAEAARMREAEQEALRYAISHDLRAPLRVVEGFTRIVKEDYGRTLDRLGQDHLDRVLAASTRMNGMIDAILAQAQLAGACVDRVPVDLTAMARDIGQDMLATQPDRAAADFEVAEGLHVEADPQLVRRVLENLIGNAFKYSAKVAAPKVEVGVMPATNPAVFYVRDNGAGFDMQHADKLFGMFQRLHSAKEFPGTGVGLAGVQNIVRRHGGRVWAEARPGEGACFYFTLMDTIGAQQRSLR